MIYLGRSRSAPGQPRDRHAGTNNLPPPVSAGKTFLVPQHANPAPTPPVSIRVHRW